MKYTKKQFFADVKAEADAIKVNASKVEIEKLDFRTFNPDFETTCVYGQMTGDCRSLRAVKLIRKSCIRYIENDFSEKITSNGFAAISKQVDGVDADIRGLCFLSSIESYIMMPNAKNADLVAYIKGEKDTLAL